MECFPDGHVPLAVIRDSDPTLAMFRRNYYDGCTFGGRKSVLGHKKHFHELEVDAIDNSNTVELIFLSAQ